MTEPNTIKQTSVAADGTQTTNRTQPVMPELSQPCQAIVTTQIVICEPMNNGSWRLVSSFTDNYNIILDQRDGNAARQEVVGRIQEIKQEWDKKKQIISLENLLTTEPPNSSKMETNSPLPVPPVEPN